MSEILFVAVPGGRIVGDAAPLRVLVVPRLTGNLSDGGMSDWAAAVNGAALTAQVSGAAGAAPITRLSTADADLWRTTFPPETLVRPFGLPAYGAPTVTPTAAQSAAVDTTYRVSAEALAADPATPADEEIRRQLAHWEGAAAPDGAEPTPAPEFRTPDFHETVSLLREHPAVLGELGLILELSLPAAALGAGSGEVRVQWSDNPLVVSPLTAFEVLDGFFLPASADDITAGMVDLGLPHWTTTTVDVDGAVGRLRAAAETVAAGGRPTLPTLRTAGVALLRKERQQVFQRRRNGGTAVTDATVFSAEQLVLGYRVDVREAGEPWRSLSSRLATYTINGRPVGAPRSREEGQIKANAMTSDGSGGPLHADETVVRWSGWSLVVPRPAVGSRRPTSTRRLPLPVELGFDCQVDPGSLPQLRFGHTYKLRARIADIAGGGRTIEDVAGDSFATAAVPFRRFEPIAAPLLDDSDPEGRPDVVVLRSDRKLSVAQFIAQNPQYTSPADRSLKPPRVPLAIAEQHGSLDGTAENGFPLVRLALENGTLPDPAAKGAVLFVRREPGASGAGLLVDRSWSGTWPQLTDKSLRLTEPAPGKPVLGWEGEVGVIRLPAGAQLTLEISSLLDPNIVDQLQIAQWLGDTSGEIISGGRHPMATPARAVRFVHAVRRPLSDPSGTLEARRGADETAVVLIPSTPLLGVDPSSTVQLDLAAAWDEWGDAPDPVDETDVVPPVTVPIAAQTLPLLRHEFGDTKHRKVRYIATAVGRFRQFFAADEPDANFQAPSLPIEANVLSSAQPARPVVRSVTPSFRWGGLDVQPGWTDLTRTRRASLRVELDRPWFTTGEGEQLAAVVLAGTGLTSKGQLVTRAGRDPIWPGTPVDSIPQPDAFAGNSGPHFPSGDIVAVPYDVWFRDGSWYCDIDIPGVATASYSPFVRLAVARFQRNSVAGLELSEAVAAEPVQLLPDRTLTLARDAGSVTATLTGIGPGSTVVEVIVERADAADAELSRITDAADVDSWTRTGAAVGALGASIAVPLDSADSARRIVVREFEQIATDTPAPPHPELTQRTVFLDVVPIR